MIVNIGDFFIYVEFERADFRLISGKQIYRPLLMTLKAKIPEDERHYDSDRKKWVIEKNPHNEAVVTGLQT